MSKTPQTELLELVHSSLSPFFPGLAIGQLSSKGGLAMQITGGSRDTTYLSRRQTRYFTLLFLCKHKEHQQTFNELCSLANHLRKLYPLPQPTQSEWVRCEMETEPQAVGITDGMNLYSCVFHIYYHEKE